MPRRSSWPLALLAVDGRRHAAVHGALVVDLDSGAPAAVVLARQESLGIQGQFPTVERDSAVRALIGVLARPALVVASDVHQACTTRADPEHVPRLTEPVLLACIPMSESRRRDIASNRKFVTALFVPSIAY